MNSADIIKRLLAEGWELVGGKGSHQKFKHPDKAGHVVVPHPNKDIALGTVRNIFRQAGWERR
ncbi:MAG: type II toxin-antitoxin system HicA family toxin [Magnetococcus sp. YQC-9]